MRRSRASLILLLLLHAAMSGAVCRACVPPDSLAIIQGDQADRGRLAPGAHAVRRVRIRNVSTHDLIVKIESKTCPCVELQLPDRIAAGQEAEAVVSIPTVDAALPQWHSATLEMYKEGSDGMLAARELLKLEVGYTPDLLLICEPQFVITRTVIRTAPAQFELFLRRPDAKPVRLQRLELFEGLTRKSVDPVDGLGDVSVLRIAADTSQIGVRSGTIRLGMPSQDPPTELIGSIRVESALIADPPGWVIRGNGAPVRSTINITRRLGSVIDLSGFTVRCRPEGSGIRVETYDTDRSTVRVKLVRDVAIGSACRSVFLDVLSPGGETELTIPLMRIDDAELAPAAKAGK